MHLCVRHAGLAGALWVPLGTIGYRALAGTRWHSDGPRVLSIALNCNAVIYSNAVYRREDWQKAGKV